MSKLLRRCLPAVRTRPSPLTRTRPGIPSLTQCPTTQQGSRSLKTRPESRQHTAQRSPRSDKGLKENGEGSPALLKKYVRGPPANAVRVDTDGQQRDFSPILLRDLCQCPQCVDPSTNQKYRPTTDIPETITARFVDSTETDVSISWRDDVPGYDDSHKTVINMDVLRQYVDDGVPGIANMPLGSRAYWDAAEYDRLPDMSYDEYMQSDSALLRILQQLHTHGLAFLTSVPESEKSVSTIAERIGPVKNTFYGYTWDVRSVPEAKNVAYTSQDLGFHMDLLYMEQPPHLQFLHCIRSSSAGGASLFTDSFRSARDLLATDVDAFNALMDSPVNFHYNHPSSALYHQRRRVFEIDPQAWTTGQKNMLQAYSLQEINNASAESVGLESAFDATYTPVSPIDHLEAVSWSPPFQAPFGQTYPVNDRWGPLEFVNSRMASWHAAAKKFNELIHRKEMVYERLMKPGECVLFDNRRVLHARSAFEVGDVGKERWLRGAYLDKDPYLSKMRVLGDQLEKQSEGAVEEATEAAAAAA